MSDEQGSRLKVENMRKLIGRIIDIPVDKISPDPENLRGVFDSDDIFDLGLNMKRIGQLDEITVFLKEDLQGKWTGEFDLHDGERRWRAATMVGIPVLRAKIIERPTYQELLLKKTSRVLQTRVLEPEKKMESVEKSFRELGVWDKPDLWESYRQQLGGGAEWPQIIRVIKSSPLIRQMLDNGTINFTLAQSIARLPEGRQEEAANYVLINKISGRFFSTQMVPYLIENPEASLSQAFEHARVGDWRQYTKSPYKRGEEPPVEQRLEDFLEVCVKWERAWEVVVHTGLIFDIIGNKNYEIRVKEAGQRIIERVQAMLNKIDPSSLSYTRAAKMLASRKLIEDGSVNNSEEV